MDGFWMNHFSRSTHRNISYLYLVICLVDYRASECIAVQRDLHLLSVSKGTFK